MILSRISDAYLISRERFASVEAERGQVSQAAKDRDLAQRQAAGDLNILKLLQGREDQNRLIIEVFIPNGA